MVSFYVIFIEDGKVMWHINCIMSELNALEEFSSVFLSAYPKNIEANEVNFNISTLNIYSEGGSDLGSFDFDRIALSSSSEYSIKPGDSQPGLLNDIKFEDEETGSEKMRQSVTNSTGSPDGKIDDDPAFTLPEILITDELEEFYIGQDELKGIQEIEIKLNLVDETQAQPKVPLKENDPILKEAGGKTVSEEVCFDDDTSSKKSYKSEIKNSLIQLAERNEKRKRSEGQQISCNKCAVI